MKHTNTPQENLLGLIALAAEHVQHSRYSYAVTALSVALDMARKLAGEEEREEAGNVDYSKIHPDDPLWRNLQ